jgi:hypothetical protein
MPLPCVPTSPENLSDRLAQLVFRELTNDEIHEMEDALPMDNPSAWRNWLKREIDLGLLRTAEINLNGKKVGFICYEIQQNQKLELCVVSGYCWEKGFNASVFLEAACTKIAKDNNCSYIRFHTRRAGFIPTMKKLGWRVSEFVMRKTIT